MNDLVEHIKTLIVASAQAKDSGDAMRFSQAALNAANALGQLRGAGLVNVPGS